MSVADKRQEFLSGKSLYRGPNRVVLIIVALVAVVGVSIFYLSTRDTAVVPRRFEGGTYNIGRSMDYKGQVISMTDIENQVQNGKMLLDLDQVVEHKLIYTEYQKPNGDYRAVTAYVSPAGRVVVGIAMCEPCRSERFRIEDNILVCETCGTRWYLNDLRGISGGCPQYPPEELPYEVEDGIISIPAEIVENWEPRI